VLLIFTIRNHAIAFFSTALIAVRVCKIKCESKGISGLFVGLLDNTAVVLLIPRNTKSYIREPTGRCVCVKLSLLKHGREALKLV
jgi:hypothetical protein